MRYHYESTCIHFSTEAADQRTPPQEKEAIKAIEAAICRGTANIRLAQDASAALAYSRIKALASLYQLQREGSG